MNSTRDAEYISTLARSLKTTSVKESGHRRLYRFDTDESYARIAGVYSPYSESWERSDSNGTASDN